MTVVQLVEQGDGGVVTRPVWPSWEPPEGALEEWAALVDALVELGGEPPCTDDPARWSVATPSAVAWAKAVCARCPVVVACRAYALAADEPGGTWGGLSDAERRQVTGRSR